LKIAYLQNYNADYDQILQSDKDHQLVCGLFIVIFLI